MPVNRYILIDVPATSEKNTESLIVLPEDYKPEEERYITVNAVSAADDVRFEIEEASGLVVDRSMIEQISIRGTIYNVILDNYVIGIIN